MQAVVERQSNIIFRQKLWRNRTVFLPPEVEEALSIRPGEFVEFHIEGDSVHLKRAGVA